MKRTVALFVVAISILSARGLSYTPAPGPMAGSPLALGQHPRIWVTPGTLPAIKARMATGGGLHNDARHWQSWVDSNFTTTWSVNQVNIAMIHYAFAYVLLKDGPVNGVAFSRTALDYGNHAKALLLGYIAANGGVIGDEQQEPAIVTYDWANPLFSASERITVINWLKTVDGKTDDGNPFNAVNAAQRGSRLLAGLAAAGDGVADTWAQSKIDSYLSLYRSNTGLTKSESDLSGDDGAAGQGISYMFTYSMRRLLHAEEGYRTAHGLSLAAHYGGSDARVFRYMPLRLAYGILPGGPADPNYPGGRQYRLEKSQYMTAGTGVREREFTFWLTALAGIYQSVDPNIASLSQWLINNRTGVMSGDPVSVLYDWVFGKFIMGPATPLSPLSPAQINLPASRRFNEGKFIFRSDWDNPDAPYVTVHVNQWHRSPWGMSPLLPGAFQIFRKGPQVINQGGTGGHDWGGGGRAGSSNILIFPDRTISAPTGPYDDEGGHRLLTGTMRGSIDFVPNSPNDALDEVRYLGNDPAAQRDVDYVFADLTRSYNSTRFSDGYNPARVSEVVREIVYFRPDRPGIDSDRMVILDRATTTSTKFEKEWLFHTSGEPMVDGPQITGAPVRGGRPDGHWTYPAATRITATNTVNGSNGRVFLTPLLPAGRVVVKVGGPDTAGRSWTTGSHEYESPYGQIWSAEHVDPLVSVDRMQYVGRYRVEIIPSVPSLTDVFLNVVEVTDAGVASPSPAVLLPGTMVAARVGNRIAAFNRTTASVVSGNFTIDQGGIYRMQIANLVPCGIYNVTVGGTTVRHTATAAGTLYFEQSVNAGTVVQFTLSAPAPAPLALFGPAR